MATMTEKRAVAKKRKANKAKREKGGFTDSVYIAASFTRNAAKTSYGTPIGLNYPGKDENDYDNRAVKRLYPDKHGNIIAEAFCGDEAFVCTKAELPQVIAFLQKLAEPKAATIATA